MLSLADVVNFFPHEFAGLRARRFSFASIAPCALECFLLRHQTPSACATRNTHTVCGYFRLNSTVILSGASTGTPFNRAGSYCH
jgi:hypothetical protein